MLQQLMEYEATSLCGVGRHERGGAHAKASEGEGDVARGDFFHQQRGASISKDAAQSQQCFGFSLKLPEPLLS